MGDVLGRGDAVGSGDALGGGEPGGDAHAMVEEGPAGLAAERAEAVDAGGDTLQTYL
jgi:hypothetical protein